MDAQDRHTDGPTDRQTCTEREKDKEVKDRKTEREINLPNLLQTLQSHTALTHNQRERERERERERA